MNFDRIPVMQSIKDELINPLKRGQFPHANLFIGQDGGVQLALAMAVARSILCAEPKEGLACQECGACRKTGNFAHPDLHFSFPVTSSFETADRAMGEWREMMSENIYSSFPDWIEKLGAESSVLNISSKECNRMENTLEVKSFEGRGKVLIIWFPEFLGNEGNKLLKVFEEPAEKTYIFLVAASIGEILPTIISRCRLFRIPKPSVHKLAEWLMEAKGVSQNEALNAAAISEGVVNEAILAIKGEKDLSLSREFLNWTRYAFVNDPGKTMDYLEALQKNMTKERLRSLFKFGLFYFNQVLRFKSGIQPVGLDQETTKSMEKMAGFLDVFLLEKIRIDLDSYIYQITRSANIKVLLTYATIQLGKDLRKGMRQSRTVTSSEAYQ